MQTSLTASCIMLGMPAVAAAGTMLHTWMRLSILEEIAPGTVAAVTSPQSCSSRFFRAAILVPGPELFHYASA